jgi:hypothetical protein
LLFATARRPVTVSVRLIWTFGFLVRGKAPLYYLLMPYYAKFN